MQPILIKLISWYQTAISKRTPARCRYFPTCSNYALTAIKRFGALQGSLMASARVLRCNPFVHGGFDPVPITFSLCSEKKPAKNVKR